MTDHANDGEAIMGYTELDQIHDLAQGEADESTFSAVERRFRELTKRAEMAEEASATFRRDALRAESDRDAARAEREGMRGWLTEALDGWADATQYKGEYLSQKHGDQERIAEIRKALGRVGG